MKRNDMSFDRARARLGNGSEFQTSGKEREAFEGMSQETLMGDSHISRRRWPRLLKILAVLISLSFLMVSLDAAVAKHVLDTSPEENPEIPTFENPIITPPEATVEYETQSEASGEMPSIPDNPNSPRTGSQSSGPGAKVATISEAVTLYDTAGSHMYVTKYGVYTFEKDTSNLMKVLDPSSGILVDRSFFSVKGSEFLEQRNPKVLTLETHLFESTVDVFHQDQYQGDLVTSVHFSDSEIPKIDAEFDVIWNSTIDNFYIEWEILPTQKELRFGNKFIDTRTLEHQKVVTTLDFSVEIGDFSIGKESEPTIAVDWSDAAQGVAYAGPLNHHSGNDGLGLQVRFPNNMKKVDPSIVVQPSALINTFSHQRRTFHYNQRYWVFYTDGIKIRYRSTNDGNSWDDEFLATSFGPFQQFDIAQRGSSVMLAWTRQSDENHVYVRTGIIVENSIEWERRVFITEDFSPYCAIGSPISVAIGSGGLFWVSFSWWMDLDPAMPCDSTDYTYINVYASGDGLNFWTDFVKPWLGVEYLTVELVPMTTKPLALLYAMDGYSFINLVYREWAGTGWTEEGCTGCDLITTGQSDSISAVASSDDVIHIIYRTNSGQVGYVRFAGPFCDYTDFGPFVSVTHPTVSVDPTGYVHAFWLSGPVGGNRDVYYTRLVPNPPTTDPMDAHPLWGSWYQPFIPFDLPSGVYYSLSSTEKTTDKLFFTWLHQGPPHEVLFSSFPIANDQVSSGATPWKSRGLSPNSQYFSSRGENVVLATGQLVVAETDITLPGRMIDLSITRIYNPRRIYTDSTSFIPCYYEESPYSVGEYWHLDYPWIGQTYLHLFNGQQYIPVWTDNVFENHAGMHFELTRTVNPSGVVTGYSLHIKSGSVINFQANGNVDTIEDFTGQNIISFTYELYSGKERIKEITDTLAEKATFTYNLAELETISYRGREVKYVYSGGLLSQSILDPGVGHLGITTTYVYSSSQDNQLSSITYPTQAERIYIYNWYGSYVDWPIGTDMWTYRPSIAFTSRTTEVLGTVWYYYEQTDGDVYHTTVKEYKDISGMARTTDHRFSNTEGKTITEVYDFNHHSGTGPLLSKTETIFSPMDGAPIKKNSYMGQSEIVNYSEHSAYDDWGNVIYSRDSLERETFATYANTKKENAFFGLGRMVTDVDKGLFYDAFDDGSISEDWWQWGDGLELDYEVFSLAPPSVKLDSTVGPQYPMLSRTFNIGSDMWTCLEFALKNKDFNLPNDWNGVRIYSSVNDERAIIYFRGNGKMYWKSSFSDTDHYIMDYEKRRWYRMGVEVDLTSQTFDIWVDGDRKVTNANLGSSSANDVGKIEFASAFGMAMWVDEIKVYRSGTLTINGLEIGQRVEAYNRLGGLLYTVQVESVPLITSMWVPTKWNDFTLVIYDFDGSIEYRSPERLPWPLELTYVRPFVQSPLNRIESGFLEKKGSGNAWVDDSLPPGAIEELGFPPTVPWQGVWVDKLAASLLKSHCTFPSLGDKWRGFYGASTTIAPGNSDFMVQYVWYPTYAFPGFIRMAFHDSGGWHSGAGWSKIQEPWAIGQLPEETNQWHMLIVSAQDISVNGLNLDGALYQLADGMACWDFTDVGDSETGSIFIEGKDTDDLKDKEVTLFLDDGTVVGPVPSPSDSLEIDLYGSPYEITAYPVSGYFEIHDSGTLEYRSPFFEKIWGGDKYEYDPYPNDPSPNPPYPFYPNTIQSDTHNRIVGTLEYQNGPSPTPPEDPVPRYVLNEFDSLGQITKSALSHDGNWLVTSYSYDSYGNIIQVSLPEAGHTTEYVYDETPRYKNAFLEKAKRTVSGQELVDVYTYYFDPSDPSEPDTGELKSATNPRGYTTNYHYDSLGRTVQIDNPPVSGIPSYTKYVYNDDNNWMMSFNENDHPVRQTFDALGRLKYVDRMEPGNPPVTVYSRVEYSYDRIGNVVSYKTELVNEYEFEYDALGRRTKAINPDLTFSMVEYDDLSNFVTYVDEVGSKLLHSYDYGGRLTSVREYHTNPPGYYLTSYEYDESGNLQKVIFNIEGRGPPQETIEYEYDDLNRLAQITYPNDNPSTSESWGYDDVGNTEWHIDRKGNLIQFEYDEASQLIEVEYPAPLSLTYSYDENGNLDSVAKIDGPKHFLAAYWYDERDRVTSRYFENVAGSVGHSGFLYYDYDKAGNLVEVIYPDFYEVTYDYDNFDRPYWVKGPVSENIAFVTYDVDDSMTQVYDRIGVTSDYSYDSTMRRLERIHVYRPGAEYLDLNYQYYDNGDLKKVCPSVNCESPAWTEDYTYDDLGRLTRYQRDSSPYKDVLYQYDSLGNRLLKSDSDVGTFAYNYDSESYNRISNINAQVFFEYDPNGNMDFKSDVVNEWRYEYDFDNRLEKIKYGSSQTTVASYYYDGLGRRVISEEGDPITSAKAFVYAGDSVLYEWDTFTRSGTNYIYLNGVMIARAYIDVPSGHYFYDIFYRDLAGNTRLVVDEYWQEFRTNYKPFGLEFGTSGTETYKFAGEHYDSVSGLYYFGVRFYDPDLGRFITEDPIAGKIGLPQSLNRYSYVLNNPFRYSDPTGAEIGRVWPFSEIASFSRWLSGQFTGFVHDTADFLLGDASWQEKVGFVAGIVSAFVVGVAIGFAVGALCATGVGCFVAVLLIGILVSVAGSVVAGVVYHGVTTALGGTPTAEGLGLSQAWGGIAAGVGYSTGLALGVKTASIEVRHYTDTAGANRIYKSGGMLRKDVTYVTRPQDIPKGASQSQVEALLGLKPGRAQYFVDIEVPRSVLAVPNQGGLTGGGAFQRILTTNTYIGDATFSPYWYW